MAPRDNNFMRFVPPNLRPALSEVGRVGYNVLDNIIGFDDEYDTAGEILARSLREDPRGTIGSMAGGVYEGARAAVAQPVETARALADEFAAAYMRAREPLPEDATREQISQRTEDLFMLSSVIPVTAGTRRAVGSAEEAVDAAQRAQAARFEAQNAPVFPGAPYATDASGETQFYYPTEGELFDMVYAPTPAQAEYQARIDAARDALSQGADPQDVAASGILAIPRRTFTGEEYDPRLIAAVTPAGMAALRPARSTDYDISFVEEADLPAGEAYYANPPEANRPVIAVSSRTQPEEVPLVLRHEMTHADLDFGEVPLEEVGTSPAAVSGQRLDALDQLNERIRAADDPNERQRLTALRDEIRGATSVELYERNPGEMLARLAEGRPTTARALSLTEVLNPYIRPDVGFGRRAAQAAAQGLLGERSGILSVPVARIQNYFGEPVNPRMYYDVHRGVPMDLGRAIYADDDLLP